MRPRVPNAARSYEEALAVYNDDLSGLCASELFAAMHTAAQIAACNPGAFVFRGDPGCHVSARSWADERISTCLALLRGNPTGGAIPAIAKPRGKPRTL